MRLVGRHLLTLLLLGVLSCVELGNKQPSTRILNPIEGLDIEQIKERGYLTVVFDNSSTSYFIYKGQPMGYEYDLMKRFCDRNKIKLNIIKTSSIEEAFDLLNSGQADVIAYFLTVTQERQKLMDFTNVIQYTEQVLVQRGPKRRVVSNEEDSAPFIENPVELRGKTIHLRKNSAFVERMKHLSAEIGGTIQVELAGEDTETEELIRKVAEGEIDYTVADKAIALVNSAYYPWLDVNVEVSLPQEVAWGVRKTSPKLKEELNQFISDINRSSLHQVIYNKYFKVNRSMIERAQSELSSIGGGTEISPFDPIVKQWSDSIGWDWRLVVSMMYQESRFNPQAGSWAGARGLMQLVPVTGKRFGAVNLFDPQENIMAGTRYIGYLDNYWKEYVPDSAQRTKFVLASYNSGLGHVQDAHALAGKLGYKTDVWDDEVEKCLELKSDPHYFRMDVVRHGYLRGYSVVRYVENIINRYRLYLDHYSTEGDV